MTTRKYFLPIIQDGRYRQPKYVNKALVDNWEVLTYGNKDFCLLTAEVNDMQHAEISGHADVFALPIDLNNKIKSGDITGMATILENIGHVPCDRLNTNMTFGETLKIIEGFFIFSQRYYGLHKKDFVSNRASLDNKIGTLSVKDRTKFNAAADSLGIDRDDIKSNMKIREVLKILGEKKRG